MLDYDVQGWLDREARLLLQKMVRETEGPILEVGSWCGLSTLTIIEVIKETQHREFISVDIFQKEENFIIRGDSVIDNIDGLHLCGCSLKTYEKEVLPVLRIGSRKVLEDNLKKYNATDFVKVVEGNIHSVNLPKNHFNLIFADVCHNLREFGYNFPRLLQLASPDCIFVIHDMMFDIGPLGYDLTTIARSGSLLCFTHNNV